MAPFSQRLGPPRNPGRFTHSYYPDGNLDTVANDTISYSFDYDNLNRLLSKNDSRGRSLGFTYDNVGNVLTKTTYQGSTTSYVYNAANRLVYLRNPDYLEVDYQYDPAGRLLSRVTSAGARTIYRYKTNGVLEQFDQFNAAGTQISGTVFIRDRVGNILTRQDGSTTINYAYDALYRLRTADHPVPSLDESYTYDKVGNRKTVTLGSLTANSNTRYYNYVSGSNRLLNIRIGSASGTLESGFTFDNEGRLTAQTGAGARSLTWDAKGRVKTLLQSGVTETYTYDPTDHRIGRSGGTLGSLNYFLEGEHLESIYKGTTLEAKYLRGSSIDELVAGYLKDTDNKLKPYIFHQDNLTSTSAVSGHNGTVHQSIQYTAFGNVRSNSGTSPNRLKYTGREDDNTGLYYYRARYYDPARGQFLSEDPKGFAAGINFYAYAGNDPINNTDPTGKILETAWDAANVGIGSYSLTSNLLEGNYGWAAVDAVGLTYDFVATAIPFLPGGASAGIQALRAGNTVAHSFNIGMDVARTADIADTAARNSTAVITTGLDAAREGTRIHNEVGNALDAGNVLSDTANNFFRGSNGALGKQPDLSWDGSGIWADLTTQGQWGKHINDYTGLGFGTGIPLIYEAGKGITSMTSLPTFMGSLTTGSQYLFGGDQFAGGGFILYPNKSNTNMMQSVYRK